MTCLVLFLPPLIALQSTFDSSLLITSAQKPFFSPLKLSKQKSSSSCVTRLDQAMHAMCICKCWFGKVIRNNEWIWFSLSRGLHFTFWCVNKAPRSKSVRAIHVHPKAELASFKKSIPPYNKISKFQFLKTNGFTLTDCIRTWHGMGWNRKEWNRRTYFNTETNWLHPTMDF